MNYVSFNKNDEVSKNTLELAELASSFSKLFNRKKTKELSVLTQPPDVGVAVPPAQYLNPGRYLSQDQGGHSQHRG